MRLFFLWTLLMISLVMTSIAQKSTIERDTVKAAQLLVIGEELVKLEMYDAAIDTFIQAKSLFASYEIWKEVIKSDVRIAKIADNFESPELKTYHSDQALNLAIKFLSSDDVIIASAYRQKAEALMWVEQLDSANYFLKKALPIFAYNKDWEELGWTEVLLAVNNLNTYQLDSCAQHLDDVASILEKYSLPKNVYEDLQSTLFDLRGITYEYQGDYNEAIKNLNEALEVNFKNSNLSAIDSSFISNQFNTLGAIYMTKGDYLRAEDNFFQSIHYDENAKSNSNMLYNVGAQYLKQKKYLQAIEYFEKSERIVYNHLQNSHVDKPSNSKKYIKSLNSLCTCYKELNKYEEALSYCQRAENQLEVYQRYITWLNMGNIYIEKGQFDLAMNYLNIALENLNVHGKGFQDRMLIKARIFHRMGEGQLQSQNPKEALFYFQKSLIANHKDFKDSINFENNPSLNGIYDPIYFLETVQAKAKAQALIASDSISLISTLSTYHLAIQWIDSLQESYVLEASQVDWSAVFKPVYEGAINISYKLFNNTGDISFLEYAFNFSEKSRSSILLEQLKSKKGKYVAGIPDSLLQKGKDLQLDVVFYQEKIADAYEIEAFAKIKLYQGYLSQSRLNLASLEEKLEAEYPKFYQLKYAPDLISIKQVQQDLLDKNSALLEYFLGDNAAYLFVITSETATMIPLDDFEKMQLNITGFLDQIKDVDGFKRNVKAAFAAYNQESFALYSQLLALPLTEISKDVRKIIIVPDGNLSTVPFEALTDKESTIQEVDFAKLPFLIYKYEFQYSYSAQLLFENKLKHAGLSSNTNCLGLAPAYQSADLIAQSGNLEQLRNASGELVGTANEISQISKFVGGKYCVGSTATERLFKEEANQFGLLHLAMHGEATLDNPNYNHLKFSDKADNDSEDNLLYQYEIANMDLTAQLVVLSACETGLGKYEKGEGVFSLARSFMYAGVPSVVMSLWRVSDASTSQLMPFFYENLANGKSKTSALHDAKLSYLESSDLTMRHPFYWSAFVVIGDGSTLNMVKYNFVSWSIGAIIILLFGWLTWKRNNREFIDS